MRIRMPALTPKIFDTEGHSRGELRFLAGDLSCKFTKGRESALPAHELVGDLRVSAPGDRDDGEDHSIPHPRCFDTRRRWDPGNGEARNIRPVCLYPPPLSFI